MSNNNPLPIPSPPWWEFFSPERGGKGRRRRSVCLPALHPSPSVPGLLALYNFPRHLPGSSRPMSSRRSWAQQFVWRYFLRPSLHPDAPTSCRPGAGRFTRHTATAAHVALHSCWTAPLIYTTFRNSALLTPSGDLLPYNVSKPVMLRTDHRQTDSAAHRNEPRGSITEEDFLIWATISLYRRTPSLELVMDQPLANYCFFPY